MIAHTAVHVKDYGTSKEFYASALAPLAYHLSYDMPEYKSGGFMQGGNTDFWIMADGQACTTHVAFHAQSADQVQAFYAAALAAGGKDNGAPGYRKDYSPGYYAAFVHDLDGNNIEAVWFDPAAEQAETTS